MTRLIRRPWIAVTMLGAAAVLASTLLSVGFGQSPSKGDSDSSGVAAELPAELRLGGGDGGVRFDRSPSKGDSGRMTQFGISSVGARDSRAPGSETLAADDVEIRTVAEIRTVIEAYRQHDGQDEKARIAKALPELVAKQFDARQLLREGELKQLEEQLRKLQELHQQRTKQRGQIIEDRVRQLLRDADGLGWGSDDEHQPNAAHGYDAPSSGIGRGRPRSK